MKNQIKLTNAFSILTAFIVWNVPANLDADEPKPLAPAPFVHPGIAHSQASIDFIKGQLDADKEPWKQAWGQLEDSDFASLRWKPRPRAHVERGVRNDPDIGASEFVRDGSAAYTHALHWALSGEQAHAKKAAEIIDAWSRTLKSVGDHDAKLLIGMVGHHYCNAAELLKHSWDGWPEENQKQFEAMLRDVWYPVIKDFYPSANGNWDASMLQTMIAMGVFLDDREIFDRAVNYFLEGKGNGAIGNYFNDFGECQESGRDQSHTQMGLEYLANTCETAWNQGVDLYGALDNRLLLGFEYTAKYNLGFDVTYEPYKSFEGRYHYKSISKNSRGRLRPMYEKVFNHYHNRKGLDAPFTKQAVDKVRPKSGGRSSLPWGTLMFANQPANLRPEISRLPITGDKHVTETAADVVIYGGTSAAVMAAVQVRRMGKSVVIVCPDKHLGGLTSGGLGWTDSGNKNAIGGLSREFYQRVWKHYQAADAWKWQDQKEFGDRNQVKPDSVGGAGTMWVFEPHVAEQIFEDFIREHEIKVVRDQWLDRSANGVSMTDGKTTAIRMLSGNTYQGRMFVDATYEGDLLAAAGVSYHVGREANSVYGETWNGIQVGVLHHSHWFKKPTDPYVIPGDPSSRVLPGISTEPPGSKGDGDKRVQAYCFRMCLTNVPENRIPFAKPDGYDAGQYELLLRVFDNGWREMFRKFDRMPNHKTDTNNHGPFSTDYIGKNYDYPEGSYQRRKQIIRDHEVYQQGYMYFMANDSRVPEEIRTAVSKWGLPKDEFLDNGGWPHQIYVREARRMVGDYVMTEHDCLANRDTPESIGMGSYTLDSHNVQRYITAEGTVQNEGDIGVKTPRPYKIAYGSILPKANECKNLLVPVCASSSHIAFGSIRMEPVFMILGQSVGTAACMAIDQNIEPRELKYDDLRRRLLADGQVLELDVDATYQLASRDMAGVVVDDREAMFVGQWQTSTANRPFVDAGYRHNGNAPSCSATFEAELKPGRYEVRLTYPPNKNRATNVPVTVISASGSKQKKIDQRRSPAIDGKYVRLGTFDFQTTGKVIISSEDTDGYVVVDAVQFLPVK